MGRGLCLLLVLDLAWKIDLLLELSSAHVLKLRKKDRCESVKGRATVAMACKFRT